MELRQLETFAKIASEGSFTRAADALSITQPAATRQIGALEAELKTTLFDRLGRRVALTAAGEELLRYAEQILRLAGEARAAVGDIAAGVSGRLAVGASSTAATYILPPILSRFRREYAGVELSVRTGPSRRVAEMVLANAADIGVVMDHEEQADIESIEVAHYANVVVAAPGSALARGSAPATTASPTADTGLPVSALAGVPLVVMQQGATLRGYIEALLAENGVRGSVTIEVDSVETIKKMVEANLGVSILPRIAVEGEIAAGTLIALPLEGAAGAIQPIGIIHRDDKFVSSSMRAFIALMRDEMAAAR